MAEIDPDRPCLTLINIFEVAAGRADELAGMLTDATERKMRHVDGFISASIHVSEDRKRVANYAQWRDMDAFKAMQADPEAQVHMKQAAEVAESFEPTLYHVVSSETA